MNEYYKAIGVGIRGIPTGPQGCLSYWPQFGHIGPALCEMRIPVIQGPDKECSTCLDGRLRNGLV
jgi:hypothetical protein